MQQQNDSIKQTASSAKPGATIFPILSLLLAATLWGVFWYPLRLLEQHGLQGLWSTLFIYSGTLVVVIPVVVSRWRDWLLQPGAFIMLALASGWCNVTFILAVLEGNIVRVLLLFYLAPLWATLLGWVFLRETLTRSSVMILVLAMLGAIIMLWHEQLGFPAPQDRADWLALSSGFAFSLANIFARHLAQVSVWLKASTVWLGVLTVVTVLLLVLQPALQVAMPVLVSAGLLGATLMILMTLSVMYGVTHMPVYRSAIILLFELIAGSVSALLLTDEVVQAREWIGGALVILAAYLSARSHITSTHE